MQIHTNRDCKRETVKRDKFCSICCSLMLLRLWKQAECDKNRADGTDGSHWWKKNLGDFFPIYLSSFFVSKSQKSAFVATLGRTEWNKNKQFSLIWNWSSWRQMLSWVAAQQHLGLIPATPFLIYTHSTQLLKSTHFLNSSCFLSSNYIIST